jgi:hypothetical protein
LRGRRVETILLINTASLGRDKEGAPRMIERKRVTTSILFVILLLLTIPAWAQSELTTLRIAQLNAERFPEVALDLVARDAGGNVAFDVSSLAISENGNPVEPFTSSRHMPGVRLIFVLDANTTFNQIDESGGLSRREKARDSIVAFSNQFMDPGERDRASILVPDGEVGTFLERSEMTFPNEVINAVNFYEPENLAATPLNQMLEQALELIENNQDDGRYPAILLFTDGAQLDDQLEFEALAERAQAAGAVFYSVILGSQADPNEIENVSRLTDPTGGQYIHMPQPLDANSLYQTIRDRAIQTRVTYRSTVSTSGRHTVQVRFGELSDEAEFSVRLEAPEVTIEVDNSQPIVRVGTEADMPLEELEPTSQPLVAEVAWPDGFPRLLMSATLLVDGAEVPLDAPVLDTDGLLTFNWDISRLDSGTYGLQVQVTDELELVGISDPLPLTIEIDQPEPPVTPTPVPPEPTPAPPEEGGSSVGQFLEDNLLLVVGGLAGLAFLVILLLLIVALIRRRRRGGGLDDLDLTAPLPAPQPGPRPAADDSTQILGSQAGREFDADATFLMPPDFAMSEVSGAYLEPLEYAPEHSGMIPLIGSNIALGRDSNLVQITFNDRSVSRLHARIMESSGTFRLYDEGSASGTYVNFERIGLTPRLLQDKDEIHFGRVHLRFHISKGGSAADSDPTQIAGSIGFNQDDDESDTQVYMR